MSRRHRRVSKAELAAAWRLWGSKDGEPPPEKKRPKREWHRDEGPDLRGSPEYNLMPPRRVTR
jgi:hypothetical protein